MGWSIGYDDKWQRDIGYGVPAYCDSPNCKNEIDRGLGYVCGGQPFGGDRGCGLFFCGDHLVGSVRGATQLCARCYPRVKSPYEATSDHPRWVEHVLTDSSWEDWRKENPERVLKLKGS